MKPDLARRIPWFELILIIAILAINGYAAFSDAHNLPNRWFTRDDAYYYFKIAQNIGMGLGSTFDGINLTNGYHPLWMVICIPIFALSHIDLILPLRILLLVMAILKAASAILLYRLLEKNLARSVAMLAALYWAFDQYIHTTFYQQGLESGVAAFCLLLFLTALQRFERNRKSAPVKWTQIVTLTLVVLLVVFSRLDLVFLALLFGLWIVFRDQSLRYLIPLDILLISVSLLSAFIARIGLPGYYLYKDAALAALLVMLALKLPLLYFLGLDAHPKSYSYLYLVRQSVITSISAAIASLIILFVLSKLGLITGSFPRSVPFIDGVLTFILLVFSRIVLTLLSSHKQIESQSVMQSYRSNWKVWLRDGIIYYGLFGTGLGLYMLWSKLTFNIASPISGQVKRWWGSFSSHVYGGAARTPQAFFGIDPESDFNAWAPITNMVAKWNSQVEIRLINISYDARYTLILILFLIALALLLLIINRKRVLRIIYQLALPPMLAGAGLQILTYNVTGYAAMKEWYWISQAICITIFGSILLDILLQPLRRYSIGYVCLYPILLYVGFSFSLNFVRATIAKMPYSTTPTETPYMESAAFIEKYTEPGSLVGMTGGGNVGYFIQDRTIINMDGLVNSYAYFNAHKAHQGSDFLNLMGVDYIFANPTFLETQPYRGQYTDRLDIIEYYGGKAIMHFLPAP